jgi:hypothetical protein
MTRGRAAARRNRHSRPSVSRREAMMIAALERKTGPKPPSFEDQRRNTAWISFSAAAQAPRMRPDPLP